MKHFAEPQRGLWHLMSTPDQQLPGTLRTEVDGQLVLEINGVLGNAPDHMPRGQHRLIGCTDDLQSISLEGCFVTRGPHPLTQAPLQTWHVGEVLVGAESACDEPWSMRGAEFDIVGLTKWCRPKPFDLRIFGASQKYVPLMLWTDDGTTVDLIQRVRSNEISETELRLETPMHLRVRAESSITRTDLHDVAIRPIQALIGLATGQYGAISRRYAIVPFVGQDGVSSPLAWLTQPLAGNLDPRRDKFGFLYENLLNLGPDAVQKAYLALKPLHLVVDLYLASLRETGYAEVGFNLVAQALESFHRHQESLIPMPKALWKGLREALEAVVEEQATQHAATSELRAAYEAVGRKLPHVNQITFRDRLQQLLASASPHAEAICGCPTDEFITAVVQTRNFYVHWDEKPGSQVVRGGDAILLKSRMLALLEISLLQIIGFPNGSAPYAEVLDRRVSWLERS